MPASLTWLDLDTAARERSLRMLALFTERESRDELGIGAIRDAIADQLFPGTSTIQTRLRYMLFIPWIYAMLEAKNGEPPILLFDYQTSREGRHASAFLRGWSGHLMVDDYAGYKARKSDRRCRSI